MLTCPALVKSLYICVSLIYNRYGKADISHVTVSHGHLAPYWQGAYQVLCHLYCNRSDLFTVFTNHLLYDISKVIIFGFPDNVQECLHHWPDEGGDVLFGFKKKKNYKVTV